MKGYAGRVLRVDLSSGKIVSETPDEAFYRTYIGGACMGAYYLLKEMPAGTDPYAPESILVFAVSPVVGFPVSGNARHCVTGKSPQTGGIASSEAGGFWGPELKFAGFDAIVLRGRASKPVYLWVHDGQAELRDATAVWGRLTGEAQDAIRAELGDEHIKVAQIGPAGEQLVRFAGIVNELKHFNGRSGLGAVMGSKNLKAIAVRGRTPPEAADPDTVKRLARKGAERVKADGFWKTFRELGTTQNVTWNSDIGGLPTRNWTMGSFEGRQKISAERYRESMMDSHGGTCWACVQSCKRDIKAGIEKPWPIESRYGGPEYETVGMLGSNCLVDDLKAIAKANELASKYCADTIALGGVIGFVMECYEKGFLSSQDLGGFEAKFGDGAALVRLAEMTMKREGFGNRMAEGTAALARSLGPQAERLAVCVKGKEFPAHMPTSKSVMGLIYAVNPFGPDHVSSEHDPAIAGEPGEILRGLGVIETVPEPWKITLEKAKLLAYSQRFVSALDSLSVCLFCFNTWCIYDFVDLVDFVSAATGWRFTMHELMLLGERRVNLMKAFNAREGFDSKDDTLPQRLFEDPLSDDGVRSGAVIDRAAFFEARSEYYRINGWNESTGNPTPTKLRELGIGWAMP